jgi:ribosomal protein L12E/L44/L45/RPP1/RPP2
MRARGLTVRADSNFCSSFINSVEDVDADEVVAVMALTKKQFDHNHITWSQNHENVEGILRDGVWQQGLSWDEALRKAVAAIKPHRRRYHRGFCAYGDSDDDEDSEGYDDDEDDDDEEEEEEYFGNGNSRYW